MKYILLLGSNLGERESYLDKARVQLQLHLGKLVQQSSVRETRAWGNTDQGDFLNQCVVIESDIAPMEALKITQQIEQESGRTRDIAWGPRTLDIDILYIDDLVINEPDLKVPHPFLQEREFALGPLKEILPGFVHPVLGKTQEELYGEIK